MKPTNKEVLTAIDESIKKWKGIVNGEKAFKIPTSSVCPLCVLDRKYELARRYELARKYEFDRSDYCNFCIIAEVTKEPSCDNTPFYDTNFWKSIMYNETSNPNSSDNQMLVFLYEIRRIQMIRMAKEFNYTNSVLTIKLKDFK